MKDLKLKLDADLSPNGYNVGINVNESAGQTIFHVHMHLIPRYKEDNVKIGWKLGKLTDEDKAEILAGIAK